MGNCLVTKLMAVVNNDNLEKLGVIKLNAVEVPNGSEDYTANFGAADGDVIIKTYGVGKVQESAALLISDPRDEWTIPAGTNKTLYFKNGTYPIEIINKYELQKITITGSNKGAKLIHIGDVAKFSACGKLTIFNVFNNDYVFGDIRNILNIPTITTVQCYYSPISGEIKLSDSITVNPTQTKIYGDFTKLLQTAPATGFTPFIGYSENGHYIKGGPCTADVSQTNPITYSIGWGKGEYYTGIAEDYWHMTWKTTRPSTAVILNMNYLDFGDDLDAMLINQAACEPYTGNSPVIIVKGNRTSASDSAVATLKSKGCTVKVNGTTL